MRLVDLIIDLGIAGLLLGVALFAFLAGFDAAPFEMTMLLALVTAIAVAQIWHTIR